MRNGSPAGKARILVTPAEACASLAVLPAAIGRRGRTYPVFGRVEEAGRLASLLRDKDAVVLDLESITADVLDACPRLKVISRFGEGCDRIDMGACREHGVRVTRTRGAGSAAVARHTLSLILALTHRTAENDRSLKKGVWVRVPNVSDEGTLLGIAGFGRIGSAVARLASDLGFDVIVYTRGGRVPAPYKRAATLAGLVDASDIVSLHLPLTQETERIVSGRMVRRLRGKYLVNTARGGLVDEAALLKELEAGRITGYATDVFSSEPVAGVSKRLAACRQVVCSPHVAAFDRNTAVKMTQRAFENIFHCLKGEHDKVDTYADK